MPEARIDYSIDIKANGIAELRRLREEDAQLKEQLGTGARAVLARRAWPGHVAELRELLAAAAVRAGAGAVLPEHLESVAADARDTNLSESLELGYHDAVRSFRRELLRHTLRTTGGNRTRAAELLGVQRTYFMRLIRELGADDVRPAGVAT